MKKNIKNDLILIGIIILLPIIFYFIVFKYIMKYETYLNSVEKYAIFGNAAQVVALLLSFINLCLIVVFFVKDNKKRLLEQKRSTEIHWFTNIIYEKNIDKIDEFFENTKKIVDEIDSLKDDLNVREYHRKMRVNFSKFSNCILLFSDNFISLVDIIDNKLYEELDTMILNFQDDLTNKLQEVENINGYKEAIEIINYNKKNFIKSLYNFNINLYE